MNGYDFHVAFYLTFTTLTAPASEDFGARVRPKRAYGEHVPLTQTCVIPVYWDKNIDAQ